jgi:hypothetical protein
MEKLPKYMDVYSGPLSGSWAIHRKTQGVMPGEVLLKGVLQ